MHADRSLSPASASPAATRPAACQPTLQRCTIPRGTKEVFHGFQQSLRHAHTLRGRCRRRPAVAAGVGTGAIPHHHRTRGRPVRHHRHGQLAGQPQRGKSAGPCRRAHHRRAGAHRGNRRLQPARRAAPGARRAGAGQQRHGRQRCVPEHRRARPDGTPVAALVCADGRRARLLRALRPAPAVAGARLAGQPGVGGRDPRRGLGALRPPERGRHHQLRHARHSQDLRGRGLGGHRVLQPRRQCQDHAQPVRGRHQRIRPGPGPAVLGHAWRRLARRQ